MARTQLIQEDFLNLQDGYFRTFEPSLFFIKIPSINLFMETSAVASQSRTEPIIPVPVRTLFTGTGGSIDTDELAKKLSDQAKQADFLVHLGNFVEPDQLISVLSY